MREIMRVYHRRGGLFAAAVAVGLGQACQDSTEPVRVEAVTIHGAPASLQVGDTTTLSASLEDQRGNPVERMVTWTSLSGVVASVSPTGRVTALAPGEARVVASAEGKADTVSITIQPLPTVSSCQGQAGGLVLAAGETRQVTPAADGSLCLSGADGGADFLAVTVNARQAGTVALTVEGTGLQAPLATSAVRLLPAAPLGPGEPQRDFDFEAVLRRRERTELRAYLPALQASRTADGLRRTSQLAAAPAVGDLLNLNTSLTACTDAKRRVGRVAAVTSRAVVVHDTTNPGGGFSDEDYRQIGLSFDNLVYPVDVETFGEPTDLDKNSRVIIFYTRAVNEMTKQGSESYVGGFFFSRDLFPSTAQPGFQACGGSNYGEMFYALAPDPTGSVNGNRRTKDFVQRVTVATLAHELQHLISAARRLYIVKTNEYQEEVWLNEGLSHIAEELVFYRAGGVGPLQNLTVEKIRSSTTLRDAFNQHGIGNFGRLEDYLENPEGNSPFASNDELATRGAAWAFLRYAADRAGGDQRALWNRLVNSNLTGLANLRAALGTDPLPLVRDWTVTMYTDDYINGVSAAYQEPSWNFRSIFSVLSNPPGSYPLRVRTLAEGGPALVSLVAGGGSFFRFGVAPRSTAQVRVTSGGVAPPSGVAVMVTRTR